MSDIRYLLDENVEPAFRTALLQHDSTMIVWKIGDPGVPPGILELNPNMSVGETVEELTLIWGASDSREYQDIILYLPLS